MKALKVSKNGVQVAIAGINDYSVLSAIITHHHIDPDSKTGQLMHERGCYQKEKTNFVVGGLNSSSGANVEWLLEDLGVGDKITVEIVEVSDDSDITSPRSVTASSRKK